MTSGQRQVLNALTLGPKTAAQVGDELFPSARRHYARYDRAHSRLRALEDHGLVRRATDPPIQWELTHAGRSALQLTT